MNPFSEENVQLLQAQYDFAAQSLGYMKENFNYYARAHGGAHNADVVVQQLTVEKMKLAVQLDFIKNYLNS